MQVWVPAEMGFESDLETVLDLLVLGEFDCNVEAKKGRCHNGLL